MKSSNNRSLPFLFCMVIEGCLVFSFVLAYSLMVILGLPEEKEEPSQPRYSHLLQNYRAILSIIRIQPEPQPADGKSKTNDPVAANFLLMEKIEKAFTQEPPVDPLNDISLIKPIHPFFSEKKKQFLLRRMVQKKRYHDYIRFYSNPSQDKQLWIWMIDALNQTGKGDEAFARFKDFLHQEPEDEKLHLLLTSPEFQNLVSRLDEDFWYKRFRYLLRRGKLAELKGELSQCRRFPLLATLFRAEYFFGRKRLDMCGQLLANLSKTKYSLHAARLLVEIDLKKNDTGNILERIEKLRPDFGLYLETLLDAAHQLFIAKQYDEAFLLYARYVQDATFEDENRWKSLWIMAWMQWRQHQNVKATDLFLEGTRSPVFPYRVASLYWIAKTGKSKGKDMMKVPPFPLTYYSMKTYGESLFSLDLRRFFVNTFNQATSAFFRQTTDIVSVLMRRNALEQAYDLVDWTWNYPGLKKVDQKMLAILKSILLYRQNDLRRTYINYKNNIAADLPSGFPPFLTRIFYPVSFRELVFKYSREYALDPILVMAIIREESFFQTNAVSSAHAMGVMQLIYETAKLIARQTNFNIRRTDLFNPEINIRLGTQYFKSLLSRYGGKNYLALAAYNAGEFRVDQWLQEFGDFGEEEFIEMIPFSQTRNYVKNVLLSYFLYTHYHEKY